MHLAKLGNMRDLHGESRGKMPRRVVRTRLHDRHLAMQQTVDAVLYPVRDPVRTLAHLDHQRERRRRNALQHRLLCAARARLVIACARSTVRRENCSMDSPRLEAVDLVAYRMPNRTASCCLPGRSPAFA